MKTRFFLLVAVILVPLTVSAQTDYVYLTWQGDTSTTMTVNFHTPEAAESFVEYSEDGESPALDQKATGSSKQIPGLADGRHIHAVELTGLEPGGTYAFRTSSGKTGKFRTLPNDGSKIRALFGGDIGVFPLAAELLKKAALEKPDVAVLGGDIAYANGDLKAILAWNMWLARWEKFMVSEDGLLVPMIVAIGNHEVNKLESDDPLVKAPFYFHFFAQGGKTYFTRALGKYTGLIVLDTGHITPFEDQVDFLESALKDMEDLPFILSSYHVPQYPSHRSFDDSRSESARRLWQPLFDEYRLTIGFENHDHTFKRSKPIRANEVNPEGTVYLGDGSMGVGVRTIDNKGAWYLEKAESKAHFWIADITEDKVHCRAIDHLGIEFDAISFSPRLAPAAAE